MIISLVNQKGGVGKTTLAINIASYFAKQDFDILLIDADPQGSVLQWQSIADNKTVGVVHKPVPTIHDGMTKLRQMYHYIIIDSPPATDDIARSALVASNLVIVPITPSPLDIWSSREILDLIKQAKKINKKLKSKIVISKKIVNTRVGREAREALKSYRMSIFKTEIANRIAYVEALISGLSVLQYAPRSEAAAEIKALCEEIL